MNRLASALRNANHNILLIPCAILWNLIQKFLYFSAQYRNWDGTEKTVEIFWWLPDKTIFINIAIISVLFVYFLNNRSFKIKNVNFVRVLSLFIPAALIAKSKLFSLNVVIMGQPIPNKWPLGAVHEGMKERVPLNVATLVLFILIYAVIYYFMSVYLAYVINPSETIKSKSK